MGINFGGTAAGIDTEGVTMPCFRAGMIFEPFFEYIVVGCDVGRGGGGCVAAGVGGFEFVTEGPIVEVVPGFACSGEGVDVEFSLFLDVVGVGAEGVIG